MAGGDIPEFEGIAGRGQEFAAMAEIDAVDTAVMAGQDLDLVPRPHTNGIGVGAWGR
jgi:hypothetical protein